MESHSMHLLSLQDLSTSKIENLIDLGLTFANQGIPYVDEFKKDVIGIYFRGNSTRTRTSFSAAALKLGAGIISYGPNDLQINTGETAKDTAEVLSKYLSAFVVRTNGADQELRDFAVQQAMPVINAMSESEHPTQVIADLIAMKETFGRLTDIHILHLGEGNNTAAALAYIVAKLPNLKLSFFTPEKFALDPSILKEAQSHAALNGSEISEHHDIAELPKRVDVVYTTRWETMGAKHEDENWRDHFWPFQVNQKLMNKVSKEEGTVFMHDLPAIREFDVTSEVLDGEQSIAFRQAHHKLHAAAAILYTTLMDAKHG